MINVNDLREGLRVKVIELQSTEGMLVSPSILERRKLDAIGTLGTYLPGHGGDVWWVKHDGEDVLTPYCYTELESLEPALPDERKAGLTTTPEEIDEIVGFLVPSVNKENEDSYKIAESLDLSENFGHLPEIDLGRLMAGIYIGAELQRRRDAQPDAQKLVDALIDLLGDQPDIQEGVCVRCGRDYKGEENLLYCPSDDCPAYVARKALAPFGGGK